VNDWEVRPVAKKRPKRGREVRRGVVEMDLAHEAAYVVGLARRGESRLVRLGPLVFFSTQGGDAWMLDPQDGLALWLARGGVPLPFRIDETEKAWAVAWDRSFRIEGDLFVAAEQAGQATSFAGYPTGSILEAVRQARSHQPPG
jgi:hypothetical protein